jgi:hypothetical protein
MKVSTRRENQCASIINIMASQQARKRHQRPQGRTALEDQAGEAMRVVEMRVVELTATAHKNNLLAL